ncbi:MAG: MraY family glycosyltransferase [Brevundimonas sp.]|uniref:MraY family glycosyltransferase n=1 Tax=Brevundimonas sp. TaxID=1871086 RepID=UPI0027345D60|nr:MraY family glycosyltransferase [Brevundimonas sp.]MDP3655592.1 MraY family glycosyltransferase [Brevundimonas sp.]MDZ4110647.1 MraY family glycosyltransferase [Brevundimonas sp.]
MTETAAVLFLSSSILGTILVLALSRIAGRLGLVDQPRGRKAHEHATPLVGGLAVIAAAGLITAAWLFFSHPAQASAFASQHIGFFVGAIILLAMGAFDDRHPIPARYKLLVQFAACTLAVVVDQAVVGDIGLNLGPMTLVFGPMVWPFTILVMVTITNAINMIDGVDGLAGGITLAVLLIIGKAALTAGFASAPMLFALAGAITAFLVFNFPWRSGRRATLFLGDAGSLVFGFALAYLAIDYSALPDRVFKPSTALWFFFIPVADTVWLYIRRLVVAGAPFMAGRDHIHHLLMERLSAAQTTWLLVGLTAAFSGAAYFAERRGVSNWVIILAWIVAFLIYGAVTHQGWLAAWRQSAVFNRAESRKLR